MSLRYTQLCLGNRKLPPFWKRVVNSACHLLILWLLYCIFLSFHLVLLVWCGSDCIGFWVQLFTLYPWLSKVRPANILVALRKCAGWAEYSLDVLVRRLIDAAAHSNIGIKYGFSYINICQLPWEVLKTEAGKTHWKMHWKTMFDRYYCIKTEKKKKKNAIFCVISCTICFVFSPTSRERYFHGLGSF